MSNCEDMIEYWYKCDSSWAVLGVNYDPINKLRWSYENWDYFRNNCDKFKIYELTWVFVEPYSIDILIIDDNDCMRHNDDHVVLVDSYDIACLLW